MTARLVTPGYWCECQTHTTSNMTPVPVGSLNTDSAVQAVRWIRTAVRTIVPALDPEPFQQVLDWLTLEYLNTVLTLNSGQPVAFTVTQATTTIQWTARPVHFLHLAHRVAGNLPACADQYTEPPWTQ
ncbi:hypothetical protein [Streptomyces albipurpureus]|uniref:Uncharacterized protein n=1 Tax=Streptomyces albipurpureus TaxID=2897419 RepID=A0ABT0UTN4_9ACTN|nr:hypothetical protein [Streptomyces sp. CWNU-1]MCM2391344.1 hypothetical protein [Streptomyces sp. CWNU-1]